MGAFKEECRFKEEENNAEKEISNLFLITLWTAFESNTAKHK